MCNSCPLAVRFPTPHDLIGATNGAGVSVRETANTDEMAAILDTATATSPPPKVRLALPGLPKQLPKQGLRFGIYMTRQP